jgi:carbon catabolite-derepressing protein kinase
MQSSTLTGKPAARPLVDPPLAPLTPREPAKPKPNHPTPTMDEKARVSNVRILSTSLPWVHQELMNELARKKKAIEEGRTLPQVEEDAAELSPTATDDQPKNQTAEQQAEISRRLRPHSRSTTNLEKMDSSSKPQGMTPMPAKKPRQTKWQFGIRSRNQPYEAMACLYKALEKQNATWRIIPQKIRKDSEVPEDEGRSASNSRTHHNKKTSGASNEATPNGISTRSSLNSTASSTIPEQRLNCDPNLPPDYYIPNDVWFIEARILKSGMYPPGPIPSGSTHSSNANLSDPDARSKHLSGLTEITPATDAANTGPASSPSMTRSPRPDPNHGVWVHIAIQLYTVESNNYMVDFKCDGYQNVIRDPTTGEWKPTTKRNRSVEKEVSSPYPYLDVASDLIAALAQAN